MNSGMVKGSAARTAAARPLGIIVYRNGLSSLISGFIVVVTVAPMYRTRKRPPNTTKRAMMNMYMEMQLKGIKIVGIDKNHVLEIFDKESLKKLSKEELALEVGVGIASWGGMKRDLLFGGKGESMLGSQAGSRLGSDVKGCQFDSNQAQGCQRACQVR